MKTEWLLPIFLVIILQFLAGEACNRTKVIQIGVIYTNSSEAEDNWPSGVRRWNYERVGVIPLDDGDCYRLNASLHHFPVSNIALTLSKNELHSIRQYDILMGPYFRTLADLARTERIIYIVTSPTELNFEEALLESRDDNYVVPIWPTWSDLLYLIKDYLAHIRLEEKTTRLHIVYAGNSENIVNVAQTLHSILSAGALFDHVGISYFTRYDPALPLNQSERRLFRTAVTREAMLISDAIQASAVNLVIGCFDLEDLTPMMKLFSDKQVDLDRTNLKWFLANMGYTVSWKKFKDLGFDYSKIRAASYSLGKNGKGVNRMAADDALLVLKEALKSIALGNFTTGNLGTAIRKVDLDDVQLGTRLKFDGNGFRTGYRAKVKTLCESPLCAKSQGTWISQGRGVSGEYTHINTHVTETTKVAAVLEHPFISLKRDRLSRLKGNQRFEGVVVDILRQAAIILLKKGKRFNYELYPVPDGKYGVKHSNGTWDGAFKEIKEKHATLAVGQISKTKERLSEFSFSPGFSFTGITFIVHKQEMQNIYFQFLRPFETKIWIGLVVTWLVSSVLIYIFHKWDPFKENFPIRKRRAPSIIDGDAPNYTDDRFARDERYNFKESVWYSYLTLAQLGTPFAAYSYPIRIYSVFYWFFALIVVSCYTGNLASFLTESVFFHPQLQLRELLQGNYEYGWMKSTSVEKFFMDSPIWDYGEMNRQVKKRNNYVKSYPDGMERVRENHNFVFVATHLLLKYYEGFDANCSLFVSKGRVDMTELAFPMRGDWDMADEFNGAMMEMREEGQIRTIFNKWFTYSSKCTENDDDEDESISLDFNNFIGLYVVLGGAMVISAILLVLKIRFGHLSFIGVVRLLLDRRGTADQ